MAMNSVHTNLGAMVALQSLNRTGADMAATQKAISTGFRVADAKDDGAAYAVAQRVRSNVGALTSANQQLSGAKGLLDTTLGALKEVSTTLIDMRKILVKLAESGVQGEDRTNYKQQYEDKLQNVKDFFSDATYNGRTLIGNLGGAPPTGIDFGDVEVVRNESGESTTLAAVDLDSVISALDYGSTLDDASLVKAEIQTGASFQQAGDAVNRESNRFGTKNGYIESQINYNTAKIDAMNAGIGAIVDADLSKEAANLQALQVRQQLGTQALSMANQGPQSLLSLFR